MLTSGRPPESLEIIGTPLAIASRAARPKLSFSDGNRKRSEKQNILSNFQGRNILTKSLTCVGRY